MVNIYILTDNKLIIHIWVFPKLYEDSEEMLFSVYCFKFSFVSIKKKPVIMYMCERERVYSNKRKNVCSCTYI